MSHHDITTGVHLPDAVASGRYITRTGVPDGAPRMLMGKSSPFGINGHYFPQAASSVSFPAFLMSTAFYFSDPGTSTFGQLEFVNQSTAPVSALVPTSFGALPGQGDLDLLPGGNYAVVTSNGDIVADLVDTAGATFVNDVVVNSQSGTAGSQSEPAVATGAHPDQALVVAFKDSPTGAGSEDITVVTTNMGAVRRWRA